MIDKLVTYYEELFHTIAGVNEVIKTEHISDKMYAFGSELAMLRIYHWGIKACRQDVQCGFSKNMNCYYFSMTL